MAVIILLLTEGKKNAFLRQQVFYKIKSKWFHELYIITVWNDSVLKSIKKQTFVCMEITEGKRHKELILQFRCNEVKL